MPDSPMLGPHEGQEYTPLYGWCVRWCAIISEVGAVAAAAAGLPTGTQRSSNIQVSLSLSLTGGLSLSRPRALLPAQQACLHQPEPMVSVHPLALSGSIPRSLANV